MRLKAYIDQLLAVVLESSPCLLEGLPRIQQNSGLKMELFSLASLTEVSQNPGRGVLSYSRIDNQGS